MAKRVMRVDANSGTLAINITATMLFAQYQYTTGEIDNKKAALHDELMRVIHDATGVPLSRIKVD